MGTNAKVLEGETLTLRLYQGLALPGTSEAPWDIQAQCPQGPHIPLGKTRLALA